MKQGTIVLGRYRIERLLGEGGFARVYEARHLVLDQLVAIKLLSTEGEGFETSTARFLREARLLARMRSPHVARVFDVGSLEDGTTFMIMEHLDGVDLSQVVRARLRIPITEAVDVVLQACDALGEAHALGIVHRDVKPANLFVCKSKPDVTGKVKLLDFGIARVKERHRGERSLTGSFNFVGSPRYMAPEQFSGSKTIDGRADIWALGVTLFELLTGRTPFEGVSITEVALRIQRGDIPSLTALRPQVPQEVERIVTACLAKNRDERIPTVVELAKQLAPFGSARWRPAAPPTVIVERDDETTIARPTPLPPTPATRVSAPSFSTEHTQLLRTVSTAPPRTPSFWSRREAALLLLPIALAFAATAVIVRSQKAEEERARVAAHAATLTSASLPASHFAPPAFDSDAAAEAGSKDVSVEPVAPSAMAPRRPIAPQPHIPGDRK